MKAQKTRMLRVFYLSILPEAVIRKLTNTCFYVCFASEAYNDVFVVRKLKKMFYVCSASA